MALAYSDSGRRVGSVSSGSTSTVSGASAMSGAGGFLGSFVQLGMSLDAMDKALEQAAKQRDWKFAQILDGFVEPNFPPIYLDPLLFKLSGDIHTRYRAV